MWVPGCKQDILFILFCTVIEICCLGDDYVSALVVVVFLV
jgi:hypothetical protein